MAQLVRCGCPCIHRAATNTQRVARLSHSCSHTVWLQQLCAMLITGFHR